MFHGHVYVCKRVFFCDGYEFEIVYLRSAFYLMFPLIAPCRQSFQRPACVLHVLRFVPGFVCPGVALALPINPLFFPLLPWRILSFFPRSSFRFNNSLLSSPPLPRPGLCFVFVARTTFASPVGPFSSPPLPSAPFPPPSFLCFFSPWSPLPSPR